MNTQPEQQIQVIDLDRLEKEGFGLIVQGELKRLPGGRVADEILREFERYARRRWKAGLN